MTEWTHVKHNVSYGEYAIHTMVFNMGCFNVPKIYSYDSIEKKATMQKLNGMSISDMYGENIENVPQHIINQIRDIILKLYLANIYYPDITGYNFMYINDKIWIYDFGDAFCSGKIPTNINFIREFINGKNEWNPEFK